MKKNVALITGVTGMVGSHLTDFLLMNTDWDIYGMARWRSPMDNIQHLINDMNLGNRVFYLYGDLNDLSSLIKVMNDSRPDYIFHLAAQSYPRTSFDAPADTYNTNIIGTSNLLESVRITGLDPYIHICASSEVYGRVKKDKLPINEECTFQPASPYAISKAGTDLIGRFYADAYGMKVLTTRMFTHTGPRRGDVFAESTFAKQIAMIESGIIPPVVKTGNLDSLRTWSDVRDAVRAYYMLLTVDPIAGEYYNIGGDYSCTVRQMLQFLISISKVKDIKTETDPLRIRPIDADLQVPDTSKFRKHTGWQPEIPFERTMTDLLDYWREKINKGSKFLIR